MGQTQLAPDLFEKLLEFFGDSKHRSQARSTAEQLVSKSHQYDAIVTEQFWFPLDWLQSGDSSLLDKLQRPRSIDLLDDSDHVNYQVFSDLVKKPLERLVGEHMTVQGAARLFTGERQKYVRGHPYGYIFRRNALAKEADSAAHLVCLAIAHDMQEGIVNKMIPTSVWLAHPSVGRYLHLRVGEIERESPNALRAFCAAMKVKSESPEKIRRKKEKQTPLLDGHHYCSVALSKKDIGFALGLPDPDDKHIARQVNSLCRSLGIDLRQVHDKHGNPKRSRFFVALDTLKEPYLSRFKTYLQEYHGVKNI
jgi:hypothetical protein